MTVIIFPPMLTPMEVEKKLRAHNPYTGTQQGWGTGVRRSGLDIDLSAVEYADFTALAQIALLVEGAARHGHRVRVSTPFQGMSRTETDHLRGLAEQPAARASEAARIMSAVGRRRSAFIFMSNCGFIDAVLPSHVPRVEELVTVSFGHEENLSSPSARERGGLRTWRGGLVWEGGSRSVRDIAPLQWLTGQSSAAAFPSWENEIRRVLALRAPSLTTSDVDAVVTIVLRELVVNVASHAAEVAPGASCPPAALVGVIATVTRKPQDSAVGDRDLLREYALWRQDNGSAAVRVVVGDSGRGICATLRAPVVSTPNVDLPDLGRKLHRSERTLLWSLSPWSGVTGPRAKARRSARGLASVRRVVRESAGAILVRSANAAAGMIYPRGARTPVSSARMAFVPGTLIEIVLAPGTSVAANSGVPVGKSKARAAAVVEPKWRDDGSLDKEDLLRLQRKFATRVSPDETAFLCLVSDVPEGEDASDGFFSELLQLAEEIADRGLLVNLCLGQSATEIAPRIRSFDDMRLQAGEVAGVPVMVVDQRGTTRWLGVDRRQSTLLTHLAHRPTFSDSVDDLADLVAMSKVAVVDSLLRMANWVDCDGDRAWLRLSTAAVDEAVRQRVLRSARAYVGSRRGQSHGQIYATPTLAAVRWPTADAAVIGFLGGERLSGYILGRHLATRLESEFSDDVSLAIVGKFPPKAAESFRAALGSTGPVIPFSGEVGLYDDPEIPFVAAGSRFVVLTSTLITAERVRHAANDLVRAGARPFRIACLLDGRSTCEPLTILGDGLPVISMIRSQLDIGGAHSDVIPIDPVQVPERSRYVDPQLNYPISRDTFLEWCERTPGALLTGHIARHSRRHFHTFLDSAPLLAKDDVRDLIADVTRKLTGDWIRETLSDDGISQLAVFYTGEPGSVASNLAKLMAAAMLRQFDDALPLRVFELPRTLVADRAVVLPPAEELPEGTAVLIVDWGSVTLNTIMGLLTAASQAGATSILALVLTSQLERLDEQRARNIRSVARQRPAAGRDLEGRGASGRRKSDGAAVAGEIPAKIHFLSSFHVGYSSAGECLPCRYSREYSDESQRGSSELLKRHAKKLAECLAPKNLAECRKDGPHDALGLALSPAQTARLMRLRGNLEAARLSTAVRLTLLDDLESMSETDLDSLVRLLVLEPRFLKVAPLRHRKLRDALHGRLTARLEDVDSDTMEPDLRRQYTLLFRAIAKKDYLSHFRQWLVQYLRRPEMLPIALDLLMGIRSLLGRPYHRSAHDAQFAERALSGALDDIKNDADLMADRDVLSIANTLSELLAHTRYSSRREASSLSAQDAWADLRGNYWLPVINHTVDARMSSVLVAVQLNRSRSSEMWKATLRDWQTTQEFLTQRVLPLLPQIRDIVLARLYDRGDEDIERWRLACTPEVLQDLQKVNSMLVGFVEDADNAFRRRDEARRLITWWHRFFFAKYSAVAESEGNGLLALLSDCPCRVGDAIAEALTSSREAAESMGRPLLVQEPPVTTALTEEVFCNKWLVREIVRQLFENAIDERHAAEGGRSVPISVRIDSSMNEREVVIRMLNDGTRVREPTGRGISYFNRYVNSYGGRLTGEDVHDGSKWTYAALLVLPRFRPVYPMAGSK